jgi:hypothetical protein
MAKQARAFAAALIALAIGTSGCGRGEPTAKINVERGVPGAGGHAGGLVALSQTGVGSSEETAEDPPSPQAVRPGSVVGIDEVATRLGRDFRIDSIAKLGTSTSIELSGGDLQVQVLSEVHAGDVVVPVDPRTFDAGHRSVDGVDVVAYEVGSHASRVQVALGSGRYVSVSFHASLTDVRKVFPDLDAVAIDVARAASRLVLPPSLQPEGAASKGVDR